MLKLAITSLVLVTTISNLALAETKRDQARTLLREGNKLHDAANYAGALERFHRARELYPSYKIDLNIAGTLDKMGRKAEAAGAFDRFVSGAPDDAPVSIVAGARKRLEELKRLVASVSVTSNVDGAAVVLDGKTRGRTPTSERLYLEPGAHGLEVRLEGYTTYGAQLELARGDHRDLTVELRQTAQVPPPLPAKRDDGGRGTKTLWAYITLGTGAALAVTAAVLYGVGKSQGDKAHDEYAAARDQAEMDRHWEDVESAETKILVGHILVGTAAAALGVSAYMFLTRPEERAEPSTSVTLVPGQGGGALVVEGRF